MRFIFAMTAIAGLSACQMENTPIVTDYNGDSVTIIRPSFIPRAEAIAQTTAEAQRICQKGHKKSAEHVSARTNPGTYETSDFFICIS